jgi:hypothetical protein
VLGVDPAGYLVRVNRRNWTTRHVLVVLSWGAAVGAFAVVSSHATGAVDACTSQHGYAPVPIPFWLLLAGSVSIAAVAVGAAGAGRAVWLSLAGVVVAALVSLAVFGIGYSCGLG